MIEIQEDKTFQQLCRNMQSQPFITLDTEFIREKTYYPVLALVQLRWPGQDPILVDPLNITDWSPFHEVLRNPNIVKVLHASRQDIEIFFYQMNEMPRAVFDTQVAAALCGYGEQIGYSSLVSKLLNKQLSKGSSYTNWLQRPLTKAQLEYARNDVRYLPEIYQLLRTKALSIGRLDWIQEEMAKQLHDKLFKPDPKKLWRKVKKSGGLRPKQAVVLQAFAAWRDETARENNRPVRFILSDEAMLELAKVEQMTLESLKERRGIHSKFIERYGHVLVDLHKQSRARPKSEWPSQNEPDEIVPSDRSESLADLAWLLIKEISRENNVAPMNLIVKKELPRFIEAYIRNLPRDGFPISSGWRWEMVGKRLTDLLDGRLTIQISNYSIVWRELKPEDGT